MEGMVVEYILNLPIYGWMLSLCGKPILRAVHSGGSAVELYAAA